MLRALELTDYRALPEHVTGWIAARLGVSVEEEVRCLDALGDAGLIRREGGHFVGLAVTVDTRPGPELARRAVKRHWAQVGAAHLSAGTSQKRLTQPRRSIYYHVYTSRGVE